MPLSLPRPLLSCFVYPPLPCFSPLTSQESGRLACSFGSGCRGDGNPAPCIARFPSLSLPVSVLPPSTRTFEQQYIFSFTHSITRPTHMYIHIQCASRFTIHLAQSPPPGSTPIMCLQVHTFDDALVVGLVFQAPAL